MKAQCVVGAVGVAVAMLAAGTASADIRVTAPFAGEFSETFEGRTPTGAPGALTIMGGAATMDDTLAHFHVVAFNWTGPGGTIFPHSGALFGGTVAGSTWFEFAQPMKRFGGYFNTVGAIAGGSVVFRDEGGATLGTLTLGVQPVTWLWQGWESDIPFKSVEVIGASVPGVSGQYDGLQASAIPAPGAVGLIGLSLGAIARRRR